MKLLPIIKAVTLILMTMCLGGIYLDVARIHLCVMCVLGAGLLGSVSFVEAEYAKTKGGGQGQKAQDGGGKGTSSVKTKRKTLRED